MNKYDLSVDSLSTRPCADTVHVFDRVSKPNFMNTLSRIIGLYQKLMFEKEQCLVLEDGAYRQSRNFGKQIQKYAA